MQTSSAPIVIALTLLLQACATGSDAVVEYLDQRTAVTVTRAAQPLTFAVEQPLRGANARDLVYAGPVNINRMGEHKLYLWLGFASLIDRSGYPQADRSANSSLVYLWVDGEPMTLHRTAIAGLQIGTARDPYPATRAVLHEAYYAITASQLSRIAVATSLQLTAPGFEGLPQRYELWTDRRDNLAQFVEHFASY